MQLVLFVVGMALVGIALLGLTVDDSLRLGIEEAWLALAESLELTGDARDLRGSIGPNALPDFDAAFQVHGPPEVLGFFDAETRLADEPLTGAQLTEG